MKKFKVKVSNDRGELENCEISFFTDDETPDEILKKKITEEFAAKGRKIISIEPWDESKGETIWQ